MAAWWCGVLLTPICLAKLLNAEKIDRGIMNKDRSDAAKELDLKPQLTQRIERRLQPQVPQVAQAFERRAQQRDEPVGYQLVTTSRTAGWFFQLAIVFISYVVVALCGLILHLSVRPLLEAIPPAMGVMFGFLILNVISSLKGRPKK